MKTALRTTIIYLVFATIWIVSTDRLVQYISPNLGLATFFSTVKGIIFVLATAALLFILISADVKKNEKTITRLQEETQLKRQFIEELHHRIGSTIQLISLFFNYNDAIPPNEAQCIRKKLQSIETVFNVIYSNPVIDDVPMRNVIDEYIQINQKNIKVKYTYLNNAFHIETLASLLLVIDSIYDCLREENDVNKIEMEIRSHENITLTFALTNKGLSQILGRYEPFINHCLKQIEGSLELQNDYVSHMIILFSEKRK